LLATDGAPCAVVGVIGDELGDEVRARDAGGGEVEADEVDEAEGAEADVVVGGRGREGPVGWEAEVRSHPLEAPRRLGR
jgi:hypothetical protein